MRGTTASGFEFTVNKESLDDWEMVDLLSQMAIDGNTLALPKFAKTFLGAEQCKALVEHCKTDGKAPVEKVMNEVLEIIQLLGDDGKN